MIPEAAVEAGLDHQRGANREHTPRMRRDMRALLEAIVPPMLAEARAQALEEAATEVDEGVPAYGQEEYADWLRARAATYRPTK